MNLLSSAGAGAGITFLQVGFVLDSQPAHNQTTPQTAGIAALLASVSSALVNLPLIYQQTEQKTVTRTVTVISILVVLLRLLAMV